MAAIQQSEIEYRLSGGATNTNPAASLGGEMSSTVIISGSINNLFDDISGDENAASDVEYRGIYVYNGNTANVWENVVMWISAEVSGGAVAAIAVADEPAGNTMETIPNEGTAPVGPVFSSPTSKAAGISLGNIPPLSYRGIWIRRTAQNSGALSGDGVTISCEGDTGSL